MTIEVREFPTHLIRRQHRRSFSHDARQIASGRARNLSQGIRTQQSNTSLTLAADKTARLVSQVKKKKKRTARKDGNGSGRRLGYTQGELEYLLKLQEEIAPLYRTEWDLVQHKHEIRFPHTKKTVESLRLKFAELHKMKVPAGDPDIPIEVERAVATPDKMTQRADIDDDLDIEDSSEKAFSVFLERDENSDAQPGENEHTYLPSSQQPPNLAAEGREPRTSMDGVNTEMRAIPGSFPERASAPSAKTSLQQVGNQNPRPLVAKGSRRRTNESNEDLISMLKTSIFRGQKLRQDEARRREQEREDERKRAEGERRERERKKGEKERKRERKKS